MVLDLVIGSFRDSHLKIPNAENVVIPGYYCGGFAVAVSRISISLLSVSSTEK
jgi:hypothetical protein